MTILKDTLILSIMREDIRLAIQDYVDLSREEMKHLLDRIIGIIAEASNKLENKK